MNLNNYLDQCCERNWQVSESDKTNLRSAGSGGKKEQGSDLNLIEDEKSALEARVQSLRNQMLILKSELMEEKALWKKEVEMLNSLISSNDKYLEPELTSDAETEVKSLSNVAGSYTDSVASSPLIREYEEKLSRYQGALAQAQAEKRLNIRRQIAVNTYRKRLNEVEKLCQEELEKVRETAVYLEPLKQMASEWNKTRLDQIEIAQPVTTEKIRKRSSSNVECGGDFLPARGRDTKPKAEQDGFDVPVKQIDASLVVDEDATNEIKGKIVLQIGSLPTEVPTICYSAKFE